MSCSLHQHHSTCLLNRRLANICLQPSRACMPCTDSRRSSPQGCSQYRVSSSNSSSSSSSIQCSAISRVKRCCTLEAAAAAREQQAEQAQQEPLAQLLTCRRCFQRFSSASNSAGACSFHPAMYTGGEVAKAIGFVRESSAPEHQLGAVVGRTGLMRFWDCCGAADEAAPGCVQGYHLSFDDELNSSNGWRE